MIIFKLFYVFGVTYLSDLGIFMFYPGTKIFENIDTFKHDLILGLYMAFVYQIFLFVMNMASVTLVNYFYWRIYNKLYSSKLLIIEGVFYFFIHLIYHLITNFGNNVSYIWLNILCGLVLLFILFCEMYVFKE